MMGRRPGDLAQDFSGCGGNVDLDRPHGISSCGLQRWCSPQVNISGALSGAANNRQRRWMMKKKKRRPKTNKQMGEKIGREKE